MILLDTHVWVWWVQGDRRLTNETIDALDAPADPGTGVHVISCWEVAMLYEHGRLKLPCSLDRWFEQALSYPGVQEVSLTHSAAVESCRLAGNFHKDPADRILVATAMELGCCLVTADQKILEYGHVQSVHPNGLPLLRR